MKNKKPKTATQNKGGKIPGQQPHSLGKGPKTNPTPTLGPIAKQDTYHSRHRRQTQERAFAQLDRPGAKKKENQAPGRCKCAKRGDLRKNGPQQGFGVTAGGGTAKPFTI